MLFAHFHQRGLKVVYALFPYAYLARHLHPRCFLLEPDAVSLAYALVVRADSLVYPEHADVTELDPEMEKGSVIVACPVFRSTGLARVSLVQDADGW
jgi:hypothetical protein